MSHCPRLRQLDRRHRSTPNARTVGASGAAFRERVRRAYTKILAELIQSITTVHNESKVAGFTPLYISAK